MALCANDICFCEIGLSGSVIKDGQEYCSEFCANSEGAGLEECECGHPDCEAE